MIKRTLLALAAAAALAAAVGCGADVCEDAYDKAKACVDQADCNKLDPSQRQKCVNSVNTWNTYANRSAFVTACTADGQLKDQAERLTQCNLDPRTCTCP